MAGIDDTCIFTGTAAVNGQQIIPQTVTNADSMNYINLNEGKDAFGNILTNPDPGMGKPVFVNIVITSAPTAAGGNTTVVWTLLAGQDAGGTGTSQTGVGGTWITIGSTGTVPYDDLVLGWKFSFLVPPSMTYEQDAAIVAQYLKLNCATATSTLTGGYYYAWMSPEPVSNV